MKNKFKSWAKKNWKKIWEYGICPNCGTDYRTWEYGAIHFPNGVPPYVCPDCGFYFNKEMESKWVMERFLHFDFTRKRLLDALGEKEFLKLEKLL